MACRASEGDLVRDDLVGGRAGRLPVGLFRAAAGRPAVHRDAFRRRPGRSAGRPWWRASRGSARSRSRWSDRPMLLDRPLLRRLFHLGALATRGMTLGVRGAAIDGQGRVCLVRHTYVAAGTCPAAASSPARTRPTRWCASSARRPRSCRAGPPAPARLLPKRRRRGRDHVALYVAPAFTVLRRKHRTARSPNAASFPSTPCPKRPPAPPGPA